tara:strand:+ start:168 stop:932 length:765 start_codon:yes stop_codon:yes gene_type:complete
MSTWYNSAWKNRYPVAINVLGGSGPGNIDVEISVPSDWDVFWNSIRSDFYDVILTDSKGVLTTFKRSASDYANRGLTLQIDNLAVLDQDSIQMVWIYFNNPDQSSDLAGSFTASSVKAGTIFVGAPSGRIVTRFSERSSSDQPQTIIQKATNEALDVFVSVKGLFEGRYDAYQKHRGLEGIDYVQVQSLDSSGTDSAARYDEPATVFIPGFVRVRTKAGSDNTDYALVCNITTTEAETFSIRSLIQVRDLLPAS